MRSHRGLASAMAASIVLSPFRPALAADKLTCVSQAEDGQRLRKESKLLAARDRFLTCSAADCPEVVTADCTRWLGEVERSLASVIVKAEDTRRQPLTDVRVLLDGALLTDRPTSTPILVNPGVHVVRYERDTSTPLEERIELSAGERGRVLYAQFPEEAPGPQAPPPPPSPQPVPEQPPAEAPPSEQGLPTSFWLLGGVGVLSASSFAVFGLWGKSDEATLFHQCAPYCQSQQIGPVQTKFIIADVSLAVAILSLGAAFWIAVTDQGSSAPVRPGVKQVSYQAGALHW